LLFFDLIYTKKSIILKTKFIVKIMLEVATKYKEKSSKFLIASIKMLIIATNINFLKYCIINYI
jgi:hypothetical protein